MKLSNLPKDNHFTVNLDAEKEVFLFKELDPMTGLCKCLSESGRSQNIPGWLEVTKVEDAKEPA